jgi:hypothetical protein
MGLDSSIPAAEGLKKTFLQLLPPRKQNELLAQ